MFDKVVVNLPSEEKKGFFYRTGKIKTLSRELVKLVEEINRRKINIKERFLIPEDFKLKNDSKIEDQDEMIQEINSSTYSKEDRTRFLNLYLGMRYILEEKDISPENLRNLYQIISKNIGYFEEEGMGEFYRNSREFISDGNPIFPEYSEAIKPENVDHFMESFFEFIKEDEKEEIEIFIKSQLMHLYFVYIHPYLDGNGRSARIVSSWYLLNHELDPYLLFNRAITHHNREYRTAVRKSIKSKDMTHYLYFIMKELKKELENVLILEDIDESLDVSLSKVERQILEVLLFLGGEATLKELLGEYTIYNPRAETDRIVEHKILPLIEKGILKEENGKIMIVKQDKNKKQYGG